MKKVLYKKVSLGVFALLMPLACLLIMSCENDAYLYKGKDSVWLSGDPAQEATTDSVLYSFKLYGSDVVEQTMNLIVNLTGDATSNDRTFKLEVVNEETNVSPGDYEIGATVLPAGKYQAVVPIKVKRTASSIDLKKVAAKLTLRVVPTDDLGAGRTEREKYSILWCDYLVKPATWGIIEWYIGPFSQARFKFIIDFTGYTEFSEFDGDYSRQIGFQGLLIKLLNQYNSDPANEGREEGWPYLNDNGEPLEFGEGLSA